MEVKDKGLFLGVGFAERRDLKLEFFFTLLWVVVMNLKLVAGAGYY
jgi:hypothetical protein